jgi:hypothetical protein
VVPRQQTQTVNDVTCTALGDGTYRINGTPSKTANFFPLLVGQGITPKPGVAYRLTGCPAGGSLSTYSLIAEAELGTVYKKYYAYDIGNGATFEVPQEDIDAGYTIRITMSIRAAVTNKIFKPMLSYEPTANYSDFVPYSGDGNLNQNVAGLYEAFSTFFDIMHPVGDLVISSNANFNPNTAAGWKGTWERDKGRFVRLAGDGDTIGSTAGADSRTLDVSNLPSHYHEMQNHTHGIPALSGTATSNGAHYHSTVAEKRMINGSSTGGGFTIPTITTSGSSGNIITSKDGSHTHPVTTTASNTQAPSNNKTTSTGSGTAFDNRPFHENFYGWVRVS